MIFIYFTNLLCLDYFENIIIIKNIIKECQNGYLWIQKRQEEGKET